ncbi:TonB-dependent receptor [Methylosinus sp. LW4]|uniref:TonB-dependent receptor n=1 Tax=Methylosinus sp. LW4 TaxID=136993 RepID=UPI00039FE732|nr:TonB-dependent receptor [Methylosinus sp. LW4]
MSQRFLGLLSGGSVAAYVAITAIPATSAMGQEAQVEDVRVGAHQDGLTRREESVLLKTPRSAGIVNAETIVEQHLERLSDLSQLVPNYRPNISNPQTSTPAIRGVGVGAGTGLGAESDTGFIIDNVFYKAVGFQWGDFNDVESFELGLGPQGTAGGKNTTVGNVNIRTQLPSFERKATFETSFGNYRHIIEKGNITGPIIDDKLAYRVAFYLDQSDGWVHDQVTGAGYLNNDRWGVRGQLYYVGDEITDRVIFFTGESHERKWGTGAVGDSLAIYANGTLGTPFSRTLFQKLGRPILTFDPYKPFVTGEGAHQAQVSGASNELNWQIGENTLTSISAWGAFTNHPHNSRGEQEVELSDSHGNGTAVQLSQEIRLASPKDQKFEWIGGLFAFYEKVWAYSELIFGTDAARWYNNPALLPGFNQHTDGKARTFNIAGFGQTTYHFDDRATLTFGLRNGYEIKEGSDFAWEQAWSTTYSSSQVDKAIRGGGGGGFFDTGGQSVARNMLTGIVNPSYKYDDNILLYGLVGRGEKAAAVNTGAKPILGSQSNLLGWQPLLTKAEYNWDYEFGVKTNWFDNKLIANFNLYWTDIFNWQANLTDSSYRDANGQPLAQTYVGAVPHVRLRGFEYTGRWNPVERLSFTFNGAYTEVRYVKFPNGPVPVDWNWSTPSSAPAGFLAAPLSLSRSNTRLEGLPMWAFNVGANYTHPLGSFLRDIGPWWDRPVSGFGYINLAWQDKTRLTNPWSVFQYWQPAYSLVNVGVGLRSDDEKYSISAWAKNVFDARYISGWAAFSSTTGATITPQLQPRYFGCTLLVRLD